MHDTRYARGPVRTKLGKHGAGVKSRWRLLGHAIDLPPLSISGAALTTEAEETNAGETDAGETTRGNDAGKTGSGKTTQGKR